MFDLTYDHMLKAYKMSKLSDESWNIHLDDWDVTLSVSKSNSIFFYFTRGDLEELYQMWKIHISVDNNQLRSAFNIIAPILLRNKDLLATYLRFKVTNEEKTISERLKKGAQFTFYLYQKDNWENIYEIDRLRKVFVKIAKRLKNAGICLGEKPVSDAATSIAYFSMRCDRDSRLYYIHNMYSGSNYNPVALYNPYQGLLPGGEKPQSPTERLYSFGEYLHRSQVNYFYHRVMDMIDAISIGLLDWEQVKKNCTISEFLKFTAPQQNFSEILNQTDEVRGKLGIVSKEKIHLWLFLRILYSGYYYLPELELRLELVEDLDKANIESYTRKRKANEVYLIYVKKKHCWYCIAGISYFLEDFPADKKSVQYKERLRKTLTEKKYEDVVGNETLQKEVKAEIVMSCSAPRFTYYTFLSEAFSSSKIKNPYVTLILNLLKSYQRKYSKILFSSINHDSLISKLVVDKIFGSDLENFVSNLNKTITFSFAAGRQYFNLPSEEIVEYLFDDTCYWGGYYTHMCNIAVPLLIRCDDTKRMGYTGLTSFLGGVNKASGMYLFVGDGRKNYLFEEISFDTVHLTDDNAQLLALICKTNLYKKKSFHLGFNRHQQNASRSIWEVYFSVNLDDFCKAFESIIKMLYSNDCFKNKSLEITLSKSTVQIRGILRPCITFTLHLFENKHLQSIYNINNLKTVLIQISRQKEVVERESLPLGVRQTVIPKISIGCCCDGNLHPINFQKIGDVFNPVNHYNPYEKALLSPGYDNTFSLDAHIRAFSPTAPEEFRLTLIYALTAKLFSLVDYNKPEATRDNLQALMRSNSIKDILSLEVTEILKSPEDRYMWLFLRILCHEVMGCEESWLFNTTFRTTKLKHPGIQEVLTSCEHARLSMRYQGSSTSGNVRSSFIDHKFLSDVAAVDSFFIYLLNNGRTVGATLLCKLNLFTEQISERFDSALKAAQDIARENLARFLNRIN
jgi:hypothetical protein